VTGMKYRRLKALLAADINLLTYHLPLDAHPELGNNAQLAALLGLRAEGGFGGGHGPAIGQYGSLEQALTPAELAALIAQRLGRAPLHIPAASAQIRRLAWCSGAAQGYLPQAAALGVDAYISGEISEQTVHEARELGIHFYSAGHHATERYGVQALGAHLAARFGLDFHFVDLDNPV
jgi:dinuclear metal center YbgI/SA1388 family protein